MVTVPTEYERNYYSKLIGIQSDRITTCPHGIYDLFADSYAMTSGDYIFSGGRSGRDYHTLFQAVSNLTVKVVVNARPFNLRGLEIPGNVRCNDILPPSQYRDLNSSALFVIVPLQDVHEAVGITAVLHAMAAGKAVVVSDVSGIGEYVIDGETGIMVPPYSVSRMRQAIQYLYDNPETARSMGMKGRNLFEKHYTFEAFADRTYTILHEIHTSVSN